MDRVQVRIGSISNLDRWKLDLSKYQEAVSRASSEGDQKVKELNIVRSFDVARRKLRQSCSIIEKKYTFTPNGGTATKKRIRFSNCQCGVGTGNWCLYIVEGYMLEEKMTLLVRKCDLYICAFINDIVCEGSGNGEKKWMVLSENQGPVIKIADHAWAHFPISISYGCDGDESAYRMGCMCLLGSISELNMCSRFKWDGTHNWQVAKVGNDTERYRLAKALRKVCQIVAETTRFFHIRKLMTEALIETVRNMSMYSYRTLDDGMIDDIRQWDRISGRVHASGPRNADPVDVLKLYTGRGPHQ